MSFKDLEEKKHPSHVEKPEDAELRARAAARHKAKAERSAKTEEHRAGKRQSPPGGAGKGEPRE